MNSHLARCRQAKQHVRYVASSSALDTLSQPLRIDATACVNTSASVHLIAVQLKHYQVHASYSSMAGMLG